MGRRKKILPDCDYGDEGECSQMVMWEVRFPNGLGYYCPAHAGLAGRAFDGVLVPLETSLAQFRESEGREWRRNK